MKGSSLAEKRAFARLFLEYSIFTIYEDSK